MDPSASSLKVETKPRLAGDTIVARYRKDPIDGCPRPWETGSAAQVSVPYAQSSNNVA